MELQKIAKSVLYKKTKTQDLRRNGSLKPKKDHILSKCGSEEKVVSENAPSSDLSSAPHAHTPPPPRPRSAWSGEDNTEGPVAPATPDLLRNTSSPSVDKGMYYTTPPNANIIRHTEEKKHGVTKCTSQYFSDRKEEGPGEKQRSFSEDWSAVRLFQGNGQMKNGTDSPLLRRIANTHNSSYRLSKILSASQSKRGSTASIAGGYHDSAFPRRKSEDKKLPSNVKALFEAVEQQDIDLVKNLLEIESTDINCYNNEGLTPLDVAVLTNNIPMAKILLYHGAKESPLFQKEEIRSMRLDDLVSDAEKRVVELSAMMLNVPSGSSTVSSSQQKENEKQLSHWDARHKLLKRMKAGYDHARIPDPPSYVSLSVASATSLLVKFDEPLNHNGAVVTRYKVQWSCFEDFVPVAGEEEISDMRNLECEVKGLNKGQKYYIRVAARNLKGYSNFTISKPGYAVPSSWRDVENANTTLREDINTQTLEHLLQKLQTIKRSESLDLKDDSKCDSPQQRKHKSLKSFFSTAPKFVKAPKRGVYLACVLYSGDKIFITSDDQLPIVKVDDNFTGSSITADMHWFMKFSCAWNVAKTLQQGLDKSSSAAVHLRRKLLHAVSILQELLGMHDLGQLYHKPIRDGSNCIVLTTVCNVKDPKSVVYSGKWVGLSKFRSRSSTSSPEHAEQFYMLDSSVSEMMKYHRGSTSPLEKGLYIGYLKIQASLEMNCVLVPKKNPNSLPCIKVRDCPNVSKEEWEWLQSLKTDSTQVSMDFTQREFSKQFILALNDLRKNLDIPESEWVNHRVYDVEVIDFQENVSFILILPSVEDVCVVPGEGDRIVQDKDLSFLSVQMFEIVHMRTYESQLIRKYAYISCVLEVDLCLAQQNLRKAFSSSELQASRNQLSKLSEIQLTLDNAWNTTRWVRSIITYARDKSKPGGVCIGTVTAPCSDQDLPDQCLQEVGDVMGSTDDLTNSCFDGNEISVGKDQRKIAKFYDPTDEMSENRSSPLNVDSPSGTESGVLQVYAAYDSGLLMGTRVRLHVTSKTTARDIINLVVKQLNRALTLKGKGGPIYSEDKLCDFCLVAVISGSRERILRDDFKPLKLQNPWKDGKLYVRLKNNLLAAIQHGRATEV
ncbi:hypothetical protein FSP39_006121 [Pinctada imbricata]|uniref:Ankyrin repeat and fibronectin type-III domain-containing protein 1 n=1 Tax=Pinctada imbricata TaxID=66713 RepID=A0AA88XVL6_PINIB|nr:hypothetical protein FSP39_006121 [Pinctada imbricata]